MKSWFWQDSSRIHFDIVISIVFHFSFAPILKIKFFYFFSSLSVHWGAIFSVILLILIDSSIFYTAFQHILKESSRNIWRSQNETNLWESHWSPHRWKRSRNVLKIRRDGNQIRRNRQSKINLCSLQPNLWSKSKITV